jgi:MscS family membrane protein
LFEHSSIETSSVRVRFINIAASSFNVEIFAYVFALDWNQFLEIQEALLLNIIAIIEQAGAEIALPSQTTYLAADSSDRLPQEVLQVRGRRGVDRHRDESKASH